MSLEDALAADRAGDIETAAVEYEQTLASGEASLAAMLNLALLYWQSTDPGVAAASGLPPEFLAKAGERFPALLDDASNHYPDSTAVRFWKRYIAWAEAGEPLGREECWDYLRGDPSELLPAMWIFTDSQGEEAAAEAHILLRQCHKDGTAGSRYVASVLQGVIKRTRHRR